MTQYVKTSEKKTENNNNNNNKKSVQINSASDS